MGALDLRLSEPPSPSRRQYIQALFSFKLVRRKNMKGIDCSRSRVQKECKSKVCRRGSSQYWDRGVVGPL